jgi:hypothetical protein
VKSDTLGHRRRFAVWVLLAVLLIAVGAAVWQWTRELLLSDPPLQPTWIARVRVLAGDGVSGVRDADAGKARFSEPFGVAVA